MYVFTIAYNLLLLTYVCLVGFDYTYLDKFILKPYALITQPTGSSNAPMKFITGQAKFEADPVIYPTMVGTDFLSSIWWFDNNSPSPVVSCQRLPCNYTVPARSRSPGMLGGFIFLFVLFYIVITNN